MYLILKRLLDISISLVTLVVLSPLFALIAIALRLTAEGEIFYMQERIGYKNHPFRIWKFATMLKNSPNMLTGSLTVRNDPRVTPVGKLLRMTKLNELPQVMNVLNGEMSVVGPRPQVEADYLAYSEDVQSLIYNTKPGMTGIGSVLFRDEEKLLSKPGVSPRDYYKTHIAPYKGELELWYQRNISLVTDAKIIFLTAWQIIFPESKLVFRVFKDLPPRPAELQTGQPIPKTKVPATEQVPVEE